MLKQEDWGRALAAQREIYRRLVEVEDATGQLMEAVDRRDQVSVRLFLSMRQEQLDRARVQRALLARQCAALPAGDSRRLRQLLSGAAAESEAEAPLAAQVEKNRILLERIVRADRTLNRRLAGKRSFYGAGH